MASEPAGGQLPPGLFRVPVEWHLDQAQAVQIDHFNFEALDRVEDEIAETIAKELPSAGPSEARCLAEKLSRLMRRQARSQIESEREEILLAILSFVIGGKKPGLRAVQLAFAAGLYETTSRTGPALARQHGISKEAFQQGVEACRRQLGLRQTRTMRSARARQTMREANYRPRSRA